MTVAFRYRQTQYVLVSHFICPNYIVLGDSSHSSDSCFMNCISWIAEIWTKFELIVIDFKCCFWHWASGQAWHPDAFTALLTDLRIFPVYFLYSQSPFRRQSLPVTWPPNGWIMVVLWRLTLEFHESKGQSSDCGLQKASKETANLKITLYIPRVVFKFLSCTQSSDVYHSVKFPVCKWYS